MRTTRDTLLGEAAEECGVPGGAASKWPSVGREAVWGLRGPSLRTTAPPGGYQGLWQTGWRGGDAAQTP